jgi:hypothetical protein
MVFRNSWAGLVVPRQVVPDFVAEEDLVKATGGGDGDVKEAIASCSVWGKWAAAFLH